MWTVKLLFGHYNRRRRRLRDFVVVFVGVIIWTNSSEDVCVCAIFGERIDKIQG